MEHRWGERLGVDISVGITGQRFFSVRYGRIKNLSMSGAFVDTSFELKPLARVEIHISSPHHSHDNSSIVAAYVTRLSKNGSGLEWCDYAPEIVRKILLYPTAGALLSAVKRPVDCDSAALPQNLTLTSTRF